MDAIRLVVSLQSAVKQNANIQRGLTLEAHAAPRHQTMAVIQTQQRHTLRDITWQTYN